MTLGCGAYAGFVRAWAADEGGEGGEAGAYYARCELGGTEE